MVFVCLCYNQLQYSSCFFVDHCHDAALEGAKNVERNHEGARDVN